MYQFFDFGWKRLVRYFMVGLLAVLPLVLTIAIVSWVFNFLRGIVGPNTYIGKSLASIGVRLFRLETGLSKETIESATPFGYFTGILIVLMVLFLLGLFLELGAKRFLQNLTERLIRKIPIVGSLYGSMKKMVDLFDQPEEAEIKAMSVVFCSFSGGVGGTGVLALMPSPEKILIDDVEYHVVMIPTAPIPFGGGLVYVPANQVKTLDMSVDNFISIYVSMGVTTPQYMRNASENAKKRKQSIEAGVKNQS
ncbi:DUF502 domain-containing protein [Pirellulaceae bacterium SH449]